MKIVKKLKPKQRPKVQRITDEHVRQSARPRVGHAVSAADIFMVTQPAPRVLPAGQKPIAMDSAEFGAWAGNVLGSQVAEGQTFLGFPYLAELAQRPEYRKIFETIATEATRKWIRVITSGEEDKSDRISQIEADLRSFRLRGVVRQALIHDGCYGRGHIAIDTGNADDPDELLTSIGDGRNGATKAKIAEGSIKGFKAIDPTWVYPAQYDSINPLSDDWYKPTAWYVMGRQVHRTRLLTIVGREVPDLLKPAYMFGGLSMSQLAKPYVDNWLSTRQSVNDVIKSFSTSVLKTNFQDRLGVGIYDLENRLRLFTNYATNNGVMAIDMATEDFANVSKPLSSLDLLQAQAQEHMASVSGIPLVKLLGVTPSGLNASSDGEVRCFYDLIEAYQENVLRDPLQTMLDMVQINRFGDVDTDITFAFEPLWSLDEEKRATVRKTEAETDQILIDTGVISPIEARHRVASDLDTPYHGLDIDDAPDLEEEEDEGLEPKGGEHATDRMFEASEA